MKYIGIGMIMLAIVLLVVNFVTSGSNTLLGLGGILIILGLIAHIVLNKLSKD